MIGYAWLILKIIILSPVIIWYIVKNNRRDKRIKEHLYDFALTTELTDLSYKEAIINEALHQYPDLSRYDMWNIDTLFTWDIGTAQILFYKLKGKQEKENGQ